jgi:CRP-like cAMP-binding protein
MSVGVSTVTRRERALGLVLHLRGVPLFRDLSADELLPVAQFAAEVKLAPGEVVFREGDDGDRLYIVAVGKVEVLRAGQRIAELGPGECFGEMALLDRTPRSATVRTLEETTLVATARDDFNDLLDLYPALARAIAAVLAGRLREATLHSGGRSWLAG